MQLELTRNFDVQHMKYPLLKVPVHTESLEISLLSPCLSSLRSLIYEALN